MSNVSDQRQHSLDHLVNTHLEGYIPKTPGTTAEELRQFFACAGWTGIADLLTYLLANPSREIRMNGNLYVGGRAHPLKKFGELKQAYNNLPAENLRKFDEECREILAMLNGEEVDISDKVK